MLRNRRGDKTLENLRLACCAIRRDLPCGVRHLWEWFWRPPPCCMLYPGVWELLPVEAFRNAGPDWLLVLLASCVRRRLEAKSCWCCGHFRNGVIFHSEGNGTIGASDQNISSVPNLITVCVTVRKQVEHVCWSTATEDTSKAL